MEPVLIVTGDNDDGEQEEAWRSSTIEDGAVPPSPIVISPHSPVALPPESPRSASLSFDATCAICLGEMLPPMVSNAAMCIDLATGRPPISIHEAIDANNLENPRSLLAAHCVQLECGHAFHSMCISRWFGKDTSWAGTCPMCRNTAHAQNNMALVARQRGNTSPTESGVGEHATNAAGQAFRIRGCIDIDTLAIYICFVLTCAMLVFVLLYIIIIRHSFDYNDESQRKYDPMRKSDSTERG